LSAWSRIKNSDDPPRLVLNDYRVVEINATLFIEVKSSGISKMTFLTDLDKIDILRKYTWYCHKSRECNTYHVKSSDS
ncbi:4249_t:CDS:1, partial [Scutellospora calospora]